MPAPINIDGLKSGGVTYCSFECLPAGAAVEELVEAKDCGIADCPTCRRPLLQELRDMAHAGRRGRGEGGSSESQASRAAKRDS